MPCKTHDLKQSCLMTDVINTVFDNLNTSIILKVCNIWFTYAFYIRSRIDIQLRILGNWQSDALFICVSWQKNRLIMMLKDQVKPEGNITLSGFMWWKKWNIATGFHCFRHAMGTKGHRLPGIMEEINGHGYIYVTAKALQLVSILSAWRSTGIGFSNDWLLDICW